MKCEGMSYGGGRAWPCGSEAQQEIDGQNLCNRHAAGLRRRQANRDAGMAKSQEKKAREWEIEVQAARLEAVLGTKVSPEYGVFSQTYTGAMVVSADFLEELAREPSR